MESYQFFVGSLGDDCEPSGVEVGQQDEEERKGEEEGEDDLNDTHSRDALIEEVVT